MNTATAAAVGTSPEVLQHYLTAGITLLTPKGPAKLVGINAGFFQCPVEVELLADEQAGHILSGRYNFNYEEVIPMLRPFSQITEPVYDGFIPALTIASVLVNDWAAQYHYVARPALLGGVSVDVFMQGGYLDEGDVQEFVVNLYEDWTWAVLRIIGEEEEHSPAYSPCQIIDYLRGQHFAVGLEPHQFIEAAPSTRTREADNTPIL